jgi:Fe2+ transport system protein FeoA
MAAQIASNAGLLTSARHAGTVSQLWQVKAGERATIRGLDQTLDPQLRQRLLDLGLTPGTTVEHTLTGTFGKIRAYLVRGAMIALRQEQAQLIHVAPATVNTN